MSQALPTLLPVSVQIADIAASSQIASQNHALGEGSAFTNLLVAQLKERGLMSPEMLQALSTQALNGGAAGGQSVQNLPESGKGLPVVLLPITDLKVQVPGEGRVGDSALDSILRAAAGQITGDKAVPTTAAELADVVPIELRQIGSPVPRTAAMMSLDDAELAEHLRSNKGPDLLKNIGSVGIEDFIDDQISKNNPSRSRAIELSLRGILDGDMNKLAGSRSAADMFPDLLAQKLTGTSNGHGINLSVSSATPNVGGVFGQLNTSFATTGNAAQAPAMSVPLGHAEWGNELGYRVRWMVGQNMQSAELRLNPPDLGPVRIRISVDQSNVSVAFTSHHAVVRDALETAMPQLREMLSQNGLSLANGSVHDQAQGQRDQATRFAHYNADMAADNRNQFVTEDALPEGGALRVGLGLIDQFV